jgi:hypothetical protein
MTNPDYFSNFSPKSISNEYQEKEDEPREKDQFKPNDLRKDFILD